MNNSNLSVGMIEKVFKLWCRPKVSRLEEKGLCSIFCHIDVMFPKFGKRELFMSYAIIIKASLFSISSQKKYMEWMKTLFSRVVAFMWNSFDEELFLLGLVLLNSRLGVPLSLLELPISSLTFVESSKFMIEITSLTQIDILLSFWFDSLRHINVHSSNLPLSYIDMILSFVEKLGDVENESSDMLNALFSLFDSLMDLNCLDQFHYRRISLICVHLLEETNFSSPSLILFHFITNLLERSLPKLDNSLEIGYRLVAWMFDSFSAVAFDPEAINSCEHIMVLSCLKLLSRLESKDELSVLEFVKFSHFVVDFRSWPYIKQLSNLTKSRNISLGRNEKKRRRNNSNIASIKRAKSDIILSQDVIQVSNLFDVFAGEQSDMLSFEENDASYKGYYADIEKRISSNQVNDREKDLVLVLICAGYLQQIISGLNLDFISTDHIISFYSNSNESSFSLSYEGKSSSFVQNIESINDEVNKWSHLFIRILDDLKYFAWSLHQIDNINGFCKVVNVISAAIELLFDLPLSSVHLWINNNLVSMIDSVFSSPISFHDNEKLSEILSLVTHSCAREERSTSFVVFPLLRKIQVPFELISSILNDRCQLLIKEQFGLIICLLLYYYVLNICFPSIVLIDLIRRVSINSASFSTSRESGWKVLEQLFDLCGTIEHRESPKLIAKMITSMQWMGLFWSVISFAEIIKICSWSSEFNPFHYFRIGSLWDLFFVTEESSNIFVSESVSVLYVERHASEILCLIQVFHQILLWKAVSFRDPSDSYVFSSIRSLIHGSLLSEAIFKNFNFFDLFSSPESLESEKEIMRLSCSSRALSFVLQIIELRMPSSKKSSLKSGSSASHLIPQHIKDFISAFDNYFWNNVYSMLPSKYFLREIFVCHFLYGTYFAHLASDKKLNKSTLFQAWWSNIASQPMRNLIIWGDLFLKFVSLAHCWSQDVAIWGISSICFERMRSKSEDTSADTYCQQTIFLGSLLILYRYNCFDQFVTTLRNEDSLVDHYLPILAHNSCHNSPVFTTELFDFLFGYSTFNLFDRHSYRKTLVNSMKIESGMSNLQPNSRFFRSQAVAPYSSSTVSTTTTTSSSSQSSEVIGDAKGRQWHKALQDMECNRRILVSRLAVRLALSIALESGANMEESIGIAKAGGLNLLSSCHSSLDEGYFIYKLLMSSTLQKWSEMEIIRGRFRDVISSLQSIYNLKSVVSKGGLALSCRRSVGILLVWDLGDNEFKKEAAKKSLGILLALTSPDPSNFVSSDQVYDLIPEWFSLEFYQIDSVMLQEKMSPKESKNLERSHAMRVLREIIDIMNISSIEMFFPKIISSIFQALSSSSPWVVLSGLDALQITISKLSEEYFSKHVVAIVASIFSVIERLADEKNLNELCTDSVSVADIDTHFTPWSRENNCLLFQNQYLSGLSFDFSFFCECCYLKRLQAIWWVKVKGKSLLILKSIFSDRASGALALKGKIAYVPNVPELRDLYSSHSDYFSNHSLAEIIDEMSCLLFHESPDVRLRAVTKLADTIRLNRKDIYLSLLDSYGATESSAQKNIVSSLFRDFLALCASEKNGEILIACARCLGALGAIDPSQVSYNSKHRHLFSTSRTNLPPWKLDFKDTAIFFLKNFLVPLLVKGESASQDYVAFSIQNILEKVATDILRVDSEAGKGNIPIPLRDLLASNAIIDICEPFWKTKYQLKIKSNNLSPPFFSMRLTASKWIDSVVRHWLSLSSGPLTSLYSSLFGFAEQKFEVNKFIFPRVVLEFLLSPTKNDCETEAYTSLLKEIHSVLEGNQVLEPMTGSSVCRETSSNNTDVMCIQIIFSLVDTLYFWMNKCSFEMRKANQHQRLKSMRNSSAVSCESLSCLSDPFYGGFYSEALMKIQLFLSDISYDLLIQAALRIDSYARALKYIEVFKRNTRIAQYRENKGSEVQNADRANGMRPILEESDIGRYLNIYSRFENEDAIQGIVIIKQTSGTTLSSLDRIVELEQSDDWYSLLVQYGSIRKIQNTYIFPPISYENGTVIKEKLSPSATALSFGSPKKSSLMSPLSYLSNSPYSCRKALDIVSHYSASDYRIDRGVMRCLIELGHYETAISTYCGIQNQNLEAREPLLALGVEACWRLGNWSILDDILASDEENDSFLKFSRSEEDLFQIDVAYALRGLVYGSMRDVENRVTNIRKRVMSIIPSIVEESYSRVYPLIVHLQAAEEIELSSKFIQESNNRIVEDSRFETLDFPGRLDILGSSLKYRSLMTALHHSLLSGFPKQDIQGKYWLHASKSLQVLRKYDAALIALRRSENCGIDRNSALLQECSILRDQGHASKALSLLEPNEIDCVALIEILKVQPCSTPSSSPSSEVSEVNDWIRDSIKRKEFAQKIHLATKIMVENKQKLSHTIINRFKLELLLYEEWDEAHFEFAKYYEHLYDESRSRNGGSFAGSKDKGVSGKVSNASDFGGDLGSTTHLLHCLDHYGSCMKASALYVQEALPRMLTLWLQFTAIPLPVCEPSSNRLSRGSSLTRNSGSSSRNSADMSPLEKDQMSCNKLMSSIAASLPPSIWYGALQQLVSRCGHPNQHTLQLIKSILSRVLVAFPHQAIWQIAYLLDSLNSNRKSVGNEVRMEACHTLSNEGRNVDSLMIKDAIRLFQNIIQLAVLNKESMGRKFRWQLCTGVSNIQSIVLPLQSALQNCRDFSQQPISNKYTIHSISESVEVAVSKAKPKTITIQSIGGESLKFLVKQERNGDLRKDARMMEIGGVINHLVAQDFEGRKRTVALRTFAVTCLNEECGILEWVNNTSCIRHLIVDAGYYFEDNLFPQVQMKELMPSFTSMQERWQNNIEVLVHEYQKMITSIHRPCFHRWFLENFPEPHDWYRAQQAFALSTAVWSVVGHILGLGDRHTENILVDLLSGEVVHVDFDCLFDKGLVLARPEIVPFRLTPNIVDALGVTGVEGVFRLSMEHTLRILRQHRDVVISVIEPFLRDPTVAWSRSGRAQRMGNDDNHSSIASRANSTTTTTTTTTNAVGGFQDRENKEASDLLDKIRGRLSGIYNLVHPHAPRIIKNMTSHVSESKKIHPMKGLGAFGEEGLPLSVSGQVQRLIDEATCDENLAQMYMGK